MSSVPTSVDWSRVDIAVPRAPVRLPGVIMAGFGHPSSSPVDIAMVAHPAVTVILDLSRTRGAVYRTPRDRGTGSLVAGLLPGELHCGGQVAECLEIRLSPATAARALPASTDLSGSVAAFRDVWGPGAEGFEERLRAMTSWQQRFALVTAELGRRLADGPGVDAEVEHGWRRLLAGRGRARVEDLAVEVGWSRQRLWSRFRSQLGVGPKRAARLVRFDRAARHLVAGRPVATVAAENGYVDQSHLHREVRALTGLTPAGVAAAPWLSIDDIAWPQLSPR